MEEDRSYDSYDDENYEEIENEEKAQRDDNLTPASVATMTPMLEQAEEGDYPHKDVELRFERYLYNTQNPDSPICEECGAKLWGKGDLTGKELNCIFCDTVYKPIKERTK